MLLLGQALNGFGGTCLYSLGVTYLDQSVSTKMSPLYIGEWFSLAFWNFYCVSCFNLFRYLNEALFVKHTCYVSKQLAINHLSYHQLTLFLTVT